MDAISRIDGLTEHVRGVLDTYAAHIEKLEKENPDALPVQKAIREKTIMEADLPNIMDLIERSRSMSRLSPELSSALDRLAAACNEAMALFPPSGRA